MKYKLTLRFALAYIAVGILGFFSIPTLVSAFVDRFLQRLASGGGYPNLIAHTDAITALKFDLLDYCYLTFGIVYLLSFFLLLLYLFTVRRPMRKLVAAAEKYASGEFDTVFPENSNDEIGFIGNTMNYMAMELASLEEDQSKFISNVSHDFRSPLTSIKGYAQAMADGTIPPKLQEKYLNIIIYETERLDHLTQSILELNKYRANGIFLDISTFDIQGLIREILPAFEVQLQQRNLTFELNLLPGTLTVKADRPRISQVLHNLLDNAIKFSTPDSSIRISTSLRHGKVFVSVKDHGIGIPKESIGKIWDRFYKTDLSRGKDKKGSGLGLSIVKEIIHAHHENINVISTEGVGTEFIFTLSLETAKL